TACHAISYPLTAYFGIPHGHGVGFTLAAMLKYNAQVTEEDCLDPRGSDYVHETLQEIVLLLGVATLEEATEKIQDLMRAIGLATRFRDMGLAESDLETIVTHGFHPDRVTNNPRRLTPDALRKMLKALY
ncbi:MAG: Alcohol dehydrogenase, iron-containing superfamily, partial [uncultured bacterium]